MSDYRQIHTKIWNDEWFLDLEIDGKLLFIYLFSNPRACLAGIYDIPLKVICFDTGLKPATVLDYLADFEERKKAYYRNGWVYIPNLMKYNASNLSSPKVLTNLKSTLDAVPDGELKRLWIRSCGSLIGYQYGIDTQSEIEKEHEHEQEQEQEQSSAKRPQPKPAKHSRRAPVTPPPAIVIYREKSFKFPNKSLWTDIVEAVGDSEQSLKLWGDVVKGYIAMGWNPSNVSGMLDFFRRGEIPHNGNGHKPVSTLSSATLPPEAYVDPDEFFGRGAKK